MTGKHELSLKPNVLLTIEHGAREILPKTLLAKHLAHRGFRVFIGSTESMEILARQIPPSIFFHKSTLNRSSVEIKELGHTFVFMDEEGGSTIPRSQLPQWCLDRYKTVSSEFQDLIFLPGRPVEKEIGEQIRTKGVRCVTSGWPRIDLWRKEYRAVFSKDANAIHRKYGRFILFPTSFGKAAWLNADDSQSKSRQTFDRQVYRIKQDAFLRHLDLVRYLSHGIAKEMTIVVRPHPNERSKDWRKHLKGLKNVVISKKGDIAPWIIASSALIQWGSTSVIQASMFGKESFLYGDESLEGLTDSASFELCTRLKSKEQILNKINSLSEEPFSEDKTKITEVEKILRREMAFDREVSATQKIVAALSDLGARPSSSVHLSLLGRLHTYYLFVGSHLRWGLRLLGLPFQHQTVAEKIRGGLTKKRLARFIQTLSQIESFGSDITVHRLGANLYSVQEK